MVDSRRDPETLLRHAEAAERSKRRGQLKVFLGYTSGVGKSYRLFDEARRRRARGEDIVIGATQATMPADVADLAREFEAIPTRSIDGVPVLDVEAIFARHPQVCLIDGLAYDNPRGARHPKRYQDVDELLDAGISVLTSINLQYIEEQQQFVEAVTGRTSEHTVPQGFVTSADELVVVDAPPEVEPSPTDPAIALDTSARSHQLAQLRERALLLTADVVEHQLESYLELNNITSSWGTQERILVCLTPRANAAAMLASGRRNADRFHGELFAVYVNQPNLTDEDRSRLERNVTLAKAQQAQLEVLEGRDPIGAILEYASARGITQLFVGHSLRPTWHTRFGGGLLDRLIRDAEGMDVRVFPH
jgi:two-component system, OmpR family, sensor histidine kinase KdpD